jgi:putative endopeptidase
VRKFLISQALLLGCAALTAPAIAAALSGVTMSYVDKSVAPGDDFDGYANGAWRKSAEIPADRSSTGVSYEVFLKAEKRNAAIIQGAGTSKPAAGTEARKIADYYAAYLDTAAIDRKGLAPVKPELDAIGALKDKAALSAMLGANMRADTDPINATHFGTENLFGLFVTQDLQHPTATIPYLMQGGLGLPDRDYYLSDKPAMAEIRIAYRAYVEQLLTLAGISDGAARADRIVALETKIAAAHDTIEQSQDAHRAQFWKRDDFAGKAPGIDWAAYWRAAGLPNQQDFSVWQPDAIVKLSALVASEPMESWQDWLVFHRLNQNASVLPKAIDDAHFAYYGKTLTGTPEQ